MLSFTPKEKKIQDISKLLLGGVAPRPIALVSTLSSTGIRNLSPFSFFNAFGANPPVLIFSPSRRGRDGSLKDTYYNLAETKECVVHAVSYKMVQQVSLASTEYEPEIDEFIKSGLTPIKSDIVKPDRVAESPLHMECKLIQMMPIGDGPASANLAICEVVKFHVDESLFENDIITPDKIDLVGRNSANFYTRASGDAIFEVVKPVGRTGIGYDAIPDFIKASKILSANNIGQLGNSVSIPTAKEVQQFILEHSELVEASVESMELTAKGALERNEVELAWKILLFSASNPDRKN